MDSLLNKCAVVGVVTCHPGQESVPYKNGGSQEGDLGCRRVEKLCTTITYKCEEIMKILLPAF